MSRIRSTSAVLITAATIAAVTATVPVSAAEQAKVKVAQNFTSYLTIEDRNVYDVGAANSSQGDLTFTRGSVAKSPDGSAVGSFTTRALVVVADTGSGREQRDTLVEVTMPGGTLIAQTIKDDPTGTPPNAFEDMVVVGGTGAYARATGSVSAGPGGANRLVMKWKILAPSVPAAKATNLTITRTATTTSQGEVVTKGASSSSAMAITGSQGTISGTKASGTFTCGVETLARVMPGAPATTSNVCRYDLPGGSILTTDLSQAAGGTLLPPTADQVVVGGTGAYIGVRGDAKVTVDSGDTAKVELGLKYPMAGKARPLTFVQDRDYTVHALTVFAKDVAVAAATKATLTPVSGKAKAGTSASLLITDLEGPTLTSVGSYTFDYPDGSIQGVGVHHIPDDDTERPTLVVVTGGTGAYAGVSGAIRLVPQAKAGEKMIAKLSR